LLADRKSISPIEGNAWISGQRVFDERMKRLVHRTRHSAIRAANILDKSRFPSYVTKRTFGL
jgi:hypothetical protein